MAGFPDNVPVLYSGRRPILALLVLQFCPSLLVLTAAGRRSLDAALQC